jgi:hypothetical protein
MCGGRHFVLTIACACARLAEIVSFMRAMSAKMLMSGEAMVELRDTRRDDAEFMQIG